MNYWIERFTNRITMEKLILYCLFAIMAVALLLSVFGQLSFSPLALLVSAAVLVFVSYGSNLLFGYLFGVGVSYESPLITALILGCLLTPTLDLLGVSALALTALVAMASKFVLVFRGRHIFNPAAIAVVLLGLTGIQYASWWVATPALLPIVAVGAFLILYKTRHLMMGLLFLTLAATLIVLNGVMFGVAFSALLALAFLSWPIVFFAGYMLTEPLTLPPRRWQQLLLAAVAAVGVALPFQIGDVSSSPQIVLVLLNLVAFLCGQRRGIRLTLSEVRTLTPTVKEFLFTPVTPLRFQPGQYIELNMPQAKPDSRGTRRSFSIVGIPSRDTLSLGIKYPETPSSFKQALAASPVGTTYTATRVSGDFVLPKNATEPLLFVAGGIGITPFVSHIRSLQSKGDTRDITVVYAVSSTNELAYLDELTQARVAIIVVSADIHEQRDGVRYVSHPYLTQSILSDAVPDMKRRHAYVSGPPLMVNTTVEALWRLHARRIHRDYFSGY